MKSKLMVAALLLTALTTPALAAAVYIDYDTQADLESYKTWAYKEAADGTVNDPLIDGRIVAGLREHMSAGKLNEVDSNPDLWATYTVTTKERTQYTTTGVGVGYGYGGGYGRYGAYGSGYGGVGVSSSSTTANTYTDGTLIVDIWDAKTKELVWRGSATDTIKQDPAKIDKQIDKFYKQMVAKWQKTIEKAKKQKNKN